MPAFSTRSICRVSCVTVSGSGALLPEAVADRATGGRGAAAAGRRRVTCAWKSKKLLEDIGGKYNRMPCPEALARTMDRSPVTRQRRLRFRTTEVGRADPFV